MVAPLAIAAVESRISQLRARLEPVATAQDVSTIAAPAPVGFDPFGPAYEAAVAAHSPIGTTAPTMGGPDRLVESFGGPHGGGCVHCAAISATGPFGPRLDPSATPTGASVGKVGGYGRLDPPAELAAFGNGRVPATALEPIGQGSHRLYSPAAAAWRDLVDAAAADGISMRITDSYRSYDEQVDLVRRKGLYSEGGLGATPGTSNHGWGLAVDADVNDPATYAWMRDNAWRFGYVEAVPREPWHWEYRPHQA